MTAHFAMLHIENVFESKSNPRKHFDDLDDLVASVKEKGVLSPVKARPVNGHFELVYGARRLRAAKAVGLTEIPALVQEMNDKEVLEEQIIENAQRTDVPPLEEAEGYKALIEKHGYTPDDIAVKVGKSKRVVYERIQLCKLGKEGRKALDEDRMNASVALLIARIPGELQAAAVADVAARDDDDPGLSYRAAVDHVHKNYMLQLKDAPFLLTDAVLVAKAGACSACPKRTGNQPELFADVKAKDVCTDPKCYRGKEDAVWALRVRDAEAKGQKVLSAAETKKVFPYEHNETPAYGTPFVALDHEEWIDGQRKSVKSLLGKDAPPPVLARTPSGKIVELTSRELVDKKVKELQPERSRATASNNDSQAKFRKQQLLRGKVCTAALGVLVDKAEMDAAGGKTLAFIAGSLFRGGYYDGVRRAAKRRGIEAETLEANVPKMTDAGLAGFIVEVIAGDGASGGSWGGGYGGRFAEACKVFGVDVKKLETAAKGGGAKAKAKPGKVCAIPGCGEPGKRTKGAPGLWCKDHGEKLSVSEKKSIDGRNKRLAAEDKKGGKKK